MLLLVLWLLSSHSARCALVPHVSFLLPPQNPCHPDKTKCTSRMRTPPGPAVRGTHRLPAPVLQCQPLLQPRSCCTCQVLNRSHVLDCSQPTDKALPLALPHRGSSPPQQPPAALPQQDRRVAKTLSHVRPAARVRHPPSPCCLPWPSPYLQPPHLRLRWLLHCTTRA